MNGDISRSTYRPRNQFSSVRMQQGRVLLDADWNEHVDIEQTREAAFLTDIIGQTGAAGTAFFLEPSTDTPDLFIHPGRFYVEGHLVELLAGEIVAVSEVSESGGNTTLELASLWLDGRMLESGDLIAVSFDEDLHRARIEDVDEDGSSVEISGTVPGLAGAANVSIQRGVSYVLQPFLPEPDFIGAGEPPAISLPPGRFLAYLETFSRTLTSLERPSIREVALGGPDTTTRTQTVWQVRFVPFELDNQNGNGNGSLRCGDLPGDWLELVRTESGRMRARAHPEAPAALCDMPARAGYRRLENQLYRVEIHQASDAPDGATFKWSRDNGSMAANWVSQDGDRLEVDFAGWDRFLGFAGGEYVELTDDVRELHGRPGTLVPLLGVEGNILIIDTALADGPADFASFALNPKIRRWDGTGVVNVPAENDGFIPLEDGVEVQFEEGEPYQTGDYWQIPARTATGDVEWRRNGSDAVFEPPVGIIRRYAPLALIEMGPENDLISIEDRRPRFTPLVKDHGAQKRRNRFLHGHGVVCGLQVRCDADRDYVRIRPGYAHAPDGTEIYLDSQRRFNVVGTAQERQYIGENGGRVNLFMRPDFDGSPIFDIELETAEREPFFQRALKGTLLMDVWEMCIRPAVEFLNEQFRGGDEDDTRVARLSHRRQISAINLLAQLVVPAQTEHVFLSREEHDILRDLYDAIRGFLTSSTFCGIDDDAPEYPDYPVAVQQVGAQTAFGRGVGFLNPQRQTLMTTTRMSDDGRLAATFGDGPNVYVFEMASGELQHEILVAGDRPVQDVAFYELEGRANLLVSGRQGGDTVLSRYSMETFEPQGDDVTIPGTHIVRLVPHPTQQDFLLAILRGRGMTSFHPNDFGPEELQRAEVSFNAVGHGEAIMENQNGLLLATAAPGEAPSDSYDRIVVVPLTRQGNQPPRNIFLPSGRTGRDGFIATSFGGGDDIIIRRLPRSGALVCVAADGISTSPMKSVFVYTSLQQNPNQPAPPNVSLETTAPVSLSFSPDRRSVLFVRQDRSEIRELAVEEGVSPRLVPAQIMPTHLMANPDPNRPQMIALNQLSNTLTIVPATAFAPNQQYPIEALRAYRRDALEAYQSLFLRFVQYLKDCACGLLYRSCAPCPDDNRLTLATITIRNQRVYHICLSPRKEVVTVNKLLYWASAIPIIPILSTLVKDFCCMILPDLVRRRDDDVIVRSRESIAAESSEEPVGVMALARAMSVADMTRFTAANATRLGMANTFVRSALSRGMSGLFSARETALDTSEVVDLKTSTVRKKLSEKDVDVAEVTELSDALATQPLTRLLEIPATISKGDRVRLYTRDDRVVMVTTVKDAPREKAAERPAKETASELAELRKSVADMKSAYDKSLADREKEIKALRAQVDKLAKGRG